MWEPASTSVEAAREGLMGHGCADVSSWAKQWFFPQSLSRRENFLQNMTLMGSNPKQMPPAPYLSSGTRCRFFGRVACSSRWNSWGQDSARQHLSLAGSIWTNSTGASHGLRMLWECSLPGVTWQYRRSLPMLFGYEMSRPCCRGARLLQELPPRFI